MKRSLLPLATAALLAACANHDPESFSIQCQCPYADGDTALMMLYTPQGFLPMDTALVSGGEFTVQSHIEEPSVVIVRHLGGGEEHMHEFIVQNGLHFRATLRAADEGQPTIEGSSDNQLLVELREWQSEVYRSAGPLDQTFRTTAPGSPEHEAARQQLDSIVTLVKTRALTDIKAHIPSAFSYVTFFMTLDLFSSDEEQEVLDAMSAVAPLTGSAQQLQEQLNALKATAPGQPCIDFEQSTPDGQVVRLSEVVGAHTYTLVDFWASWCRPCRAEMPTVVEAYKRFKGRGLEIVGVSLDQDKARWTATADSLGMTWPQVSDLRGWQNEAAALYCVQSIPSCFLIDSTGTIVAKNLRGDDLLAKLEELLK